MDLKSGVVLFVGDGKGSDALDPFWPRLKASGATVKAVAIDMSIAYVSAVQHHLPEAAIVIDRFHITKLLNDKIAQLRRQLFHQISSPPDAYGAVGVDGEMRIQCRRTHDWSCLVD